MKDEAKAGSLRSEDVPPAGDVRPAATDPSRQSAASGTALDDLTRTRIGTHLRAMYDQMVQQPVPDRFRDLIARLDASEAPGSGHPGEETDSGRT